MLKGDLDDLTADVGRRHNCSTALSVLGGSAGLNLTVGAGNGSTTFLIASVGTVLIKHKLHARLI